MKLLMLADLHRTVEDVLLAFRSEKVPVAAVGGYAMQIYGSDRMTGDVDVVASRVPDSLRTLRKLSFGGTAVRTRHGVPVDIIVRSDRYAKLYRAALRHAHAVRGAPIRVVSMPYLAAMKMASGRPKDEMDLQFLIGRMTSSERRATRAIVERYLGLYASDDFDALVLETEWRSKRSRDRVRRRRR